jgi:hypothetical protein
MQHCSPNTFKTTRDDLQQKLLLIEYLVVGGVAVWSQDLGDARCRPARLLEKTSAGNFITPSDRVTWSST